MVFLQVSATARSAEMFAAAPSRKHAAETTNQELGKVSNTYLHYMLTSAIP